MFQFVEKMPNKFVIENLVITSQCHCKSRPRIRRKEATLYLWDNSDNKVQLLYFKLLQPFRIMFRIKYFQGEEWGRVEER